jgi:uncharacterized protein (TIGR02001 family)
MSSRTVHVWIRSAVQTHAPAQAAARMRLVAAVGLLALVAPLSAGAQSSEAPIAPPATTAATPTAPSFDASVGAAIASDYNYRGYTLSDHKPSASTTFEATYGIFFASNDAASVDMPNLSQIQLTDTVGIRPVLGSLTVETGVEYYSYPDSPIDIAYPEYYAAPTYAVTPHVTLGLNFYYAPDYSRTGAWEYYMSATGKYTFDSGLSFSGELGHQSFGTTTPTATSPAIALPLYTYWNLGFSYVYKALTFDLRYYASTLSRQSCYLITGTGTPAAGSNGCTPAVIGTLSWSIEASDLK